MTPVPKHPNEVSRHFRTRNMRESKAVADFKLGNPQLLVRVEHIDLDGDDKPYPCVWPGCMAPCIESSSLCSEHELLFVALAGHRSPRVENLIDWNDTLHDRTAWLIPVCNKEELEVRGKIKLVLIRTDECGCRTFRQSLGGLEVGGLMLEPCLAHAAETEALHRQAMEDYRRGQEVKAQDAAPPVPAPQ